MLFQGMLKFTLVMLHHFSLLFPPQDLPRTVRRIATAKIGNAIDLVVHTTFSSLLKMHSQLFNALLELQVHPSKVGVDSTEMQLKRTHYPKIILRSNTIFIVTLSMSRSF